MTNHDGLVLQILHEPDSVIIRLVGNGSNVYGDPVREEMRGALTGSPSRVVFDLSRLTFINSVLVGVVVEFVARVRRTGAAMELLEARGQVLDVLRKCNVTELLRFETGDEGPQIHVDTGRASVGRRGAR